MFQKQSISFSTDKNERSKQYHNQQHGTVSNTEPAHITGFKKTRFF